MPSNQKGTNTEDNQLVPRLPVPAEGKVLQLLQPEDIPAINQNEEHPNYRLQLPP